MKYQVQIYVDKYWRRSLKIYDSYDEASKRREELIAIGTAARHIKIVIAKPPKSKQ